MKRSCAPAEVDALVELLPEQFAWSDAERTKGNCIEVSRIAVAVWRRLGIDCKPVACDVVALNAAGRVLADTKVPIASWPSFAWSVGAESGGRIEHDGSGVEPHRLTAWSGHLVVHGRDWFADLTAQQFSRPDKRIVIDGAIVGPLNDGVGVEIGLDDGAVLRWYWQRAISSFRSTPAWRTDVQRELIDGLVERVRQHVEVGA